MDNAAGQDDAPAVDIGPDAKPVKPAKPYPDFPLFAHATGRWGKKIRGRTHYFGQWGDQQGALARDPKVKDDLHAGRVPRPATDELTLRDIVNHCHSAKRSAVDSNEITARTWAEYYSSSGRLLDFMGKERLVADMHSEDYGEKTPPSWTTSSGPGRRSKYATGCTPTCAAVSLSNWRVARNSTT